MIYMLRRLRGWSVLCLLMAAVSLVSGCGFFDFGSSDLQKNSAASTQVYDAAGNLLATLHAEENRVPVPLKEIPEHLKKAFIATEDARFYDHPGIDVRGIARAVWVNVTSGGVAEGASTITQQLARNALLTHERTFTRKVREIFLAFELEAKYSKNEILEMYLNQIYFGEGAYGVQAAAQAYFGKDVRELSLAECAMLAGLPQRPSELSPLRNPKGAKERQQVVLEQMVKYNYLDSLSAAKAAKVELRYGGSGARKQETTASYFVDYVTQRLIEKYGARMVYSGGLKVYTTLDSEMQQAAEQALWSQLPKSHTSEGGVQQPQGALVALEPSTGAIRAMVGGRGTDQFNRAVLAERQPGSAFKPFVYLSVLQQGVSPEARIDDRAVTFGSYAPQNYDGRFRGVVTLRQALEQSLNVVAVRLARQVGPEKIVENAEKMGITTLVKSGSVNDMTLGMSLGGLTRGVTPLELAEAYGVMANQGARAPSMAILKVVDRNGKVLEDNRPQSTQVVDSRAVSVLVDMMRGVISRGTGTGAGIGRPAAGKTGTTNDYKDAWFAGFTPNLAAVVWLGADDNRSLGGITGGENPASIWRQFMKAATAKLPVRDFPSPAGGFNKGLGELGASQASQLPPEELKDAIILDGEMKADKTKENEKGTSGAGAKDPKGQPPALRLEDRPLEEPGGKGKAATQPPTAPPPKETL